MTKRILRPYLVVMYYLSWVWFGLVGLGLNLVCILLLPLPGRRLRANGVRAAIRVLFDFWVKWFHASKVMRVDWIGFDEPLKPGTVYIANHPALLDATILLARLPNAVCIFKPSLMHNPAIGPAAIMAGYASGDGGVDTIREAAAKVASGCSILIFPEGTRTAPGSATAPFKPGFALIAAQADAPVQLITIKITPDLTVRGRAWWKPPSVLPARMQITRDRRWEHVDERHATVLVAEVDQRVAEVVKNPTPATRT